MGFFKDEAWIGPGRLPTPRLLPGGWAGMEVEASRDVPGFMEVDWRVPWKAMSNGQRNTATDWVSPLMCSD